MQRLTLAQQVAQLEDPAPVDIDPEDIYGAEKNNADVDDDHPNLVRQNGTAATEHYVEVGPSELRKLHDRLPDPKYDSVKTSRNNLLSHESSDGSDEEDDVPEEYHQDATSASDQSQEDEVERRDISPPDTSKSINNVQHKSGLQSDEEMTSQHQNLASSLRHARAADKLKGKAVSRQLGIWDSLVNARIRLQKSVTAANKLPQPDKMSLYAAGLAGRTAIDNFLSETLQLSEEIFELRCALLAEKGLTQPPRKKRRVDSNTDEPNYESLIGESTAELAALDANMHSDTLSTLHKWSSKVQAVAPSALLSSSRVSFKTGPAQIKSVAELVEDTLREPDKAVRRTWSRVVKGARIGGSSQAEEEGDEETFDDREFYQGLLRDVIESKGGKDGTSLAELRVNGRKSQKKGAVDTKASKGRKLRYEPHEKLQHFMVPVPVRGAWHDEQIDELFASLLGRDFKGHGHTEETPKTTDGAVNVAGPALQGFRVFG